MGANKKHWSPQEKEFLFSNLDKMSMQELCEGLNKSEMAVTLFLHRKRKSKRTIVKDNVLIRLLENKFVNPEYFEPTRAFYNAVKIGQKRWWALYKGEEQITDEEYIRVATHLQVSLEDAIQTRQLKLF